MRVMKMTSRTVMLTMWVPLCAALADPVGTAFTYQGQLKQGGVPLDGTADFVFTLWDAATEGAQVGPTLTFDGLGGNPPPILITNGLFNVKLDFGSVLFTGQGRCLEVAVAAPYFKGEGT